MSNHTKTYWYNIVKPCEEDVHFFATALACSEHSLDQGDLLSD